MSAATAATKFKLETNTTSTPAITIIPVEQSLKTNSSASTSASTTTPPLPSTTLLTGNASANAVAAAGVTPPAAADRIEWSRATILGFIEDYRRQRVLWDPNTKGYHIKQTKYEALKALSQKYGTEIRSIRSKIKSLRSSFHREHGKVLNGRNRGVHYQPMWFAYEAIRFILDGERGGGAGGGGSCDFDEEECSVGNGTVGNELLLPCELTAQPEEKLALMQSLDLEHFMRGGGGKAASITKRIDKMEEAEEREETTKEAQQQSAQQAQQQQQQQQQQQLLTAAVAAMAAAAAAAMSTATPTSTPASTPASNLDEQATVAAANHMATTVGLKGTSVESATTGGAVVVTRSDMLLDGENYCNISAEDVKTEIIEPDEPELTIFERRHITPSPINYNKPTDLTHNRKRKNMDENGSASPAKQQLQQHTVLSGNPLPFHPHITLHPLNPMTHNLSHSFASSQLSPQQQLQQHSNNAHKQQQQQRNASPIINNCVAHSNNHNNNHNNSIAATVSSSNTNIASSSMSAGLVVSSNNNTSNNNNNNHNNNSSNNSNYNHNNNQKSISANNHIDEYGVFGEYVAITIRKLKTSKAKIVVKHLINNLLYEAELGKYDHGIPASKEPPQLYKMQ